MIDHKKIPSYLICFIIGFILIFRLQVASFRLSYELLSLYGAISIFSIYLITKKQFIPAMFLLLCMFASYYPICSLKSIQALRIVLVGVVLYYSLVQLRPDKILIYNALCVACLVHCAFLILQFFNVDPYIIFGLKTQLQNIGLTANPNEASAMIALCFSCFFRKYWAWAIPVLFFGLFVSKSFGGILAVAIISGYFFGMNGLKFIAAMVPLSILIGVYYFIDTPGYEARARIWSAAVKFYFEEGIFTGVGIGHWDYISSKYLIGSYKTQYFHRAHNMFLQCWFELGMAFPILVLFYTKRLYNQVKSNHVFIFALISITITCSVNSVFRMNALNGFIIIVWLSLIESEWRESN